MNAPTLEERNAELVAGLRAAADFFEAHPGQLPVPFGVRMYAHAATSLRQPQRFAAVHDAAEVMDVPVTIGNDRSRVAKRAFGPVELTVFASADERLTVGAVVTRSQDTEAAVA